MLFFIPLCQFLTKGGKTLRSHFPSTNFLDVIVTELLFAIVPTFPNRVLFAIWLRTPLRCDALAPSPGSLDALANPTTGHSGSTPLSLNGTTSGAWAI